MRIIAPGFLMQAPINSFTLENIVAKPAWKTILLDLIVSKSIDPWNIDIVEIADAFLKKVREMQSLDLIIPANIILAAAILLRYKSEVLRFEETAQQQIDEQPPTQFFPDDIPQLTLASRIPPKRQITLDELTAEMERIIKYETTERTVKRRAELEIVSIKLNGIDLEKKMEEVLELIRKNVDNERWALFSRITKGKKKDEVAFYLLSLLHLTQKRMIDIRQDKMWDEIFIYLL